MECPLYTAEDLKQKREGSVWTDKNADGIAGRAVFLSIGKGQEFVIPEVILTCSNQGLGKLSQNLQRCIRKNLCRGKYKEKVRPVLINSWEACYFDFTGEDIYHLAEQAKDLGIDMVVLDDGWFGSRNDDNSGLGDWKVNEESCREVLVT